MYECSKKRVKYIGIYLFGMLAVPIVLSILSAILQEQFGDTLITDEFVLTISNFAAYGITFVWYLKLFRNKISDDMAYSNWLSNIKYIGLFYLVVVLLNIVESFFYMKPVSDNQETLNTIFDYSMIIGGITTGFMAPFVEEIVYRYILQDWLRTKIKSRWLVILISAFVFAIIHVSEIDIWVFADYFIMALFLTILYEKKHNIFTNIIVHSAYNIIQVLLILLVAVI